MIEKPTSPLISFIFHLLSWVKYDILHAGKMQLNQELAHDVAKHLLVYCT